MSKTEDILYGTIRDLREQEAIMARNLDYLHKRERIYIDITEKLKN